MADYEVVILNFAPFMVGDAAKRQRLDELPPAEDFVRLLFSKDSEVIALGRPDIWVGDTSYRSLSYWLPVIPEVQDGKGEAITNIAEPLEFYFEHVKRYSFFYSNNLSKSEYFPPIDLDELDLSAVHIWGHMSPVATTRFDHPVGVAIRLVTVRETSRGTLEKYEEGRSSNLAIWLPPPTEVPPTEAINLILSHRYGVFTKNAPPKWIHDYKLPTMMPIEDEIAALEAEASRIQRFRDELRQELARASRFRMLLYETGIDVLEPVVRDALRELGAVVEDPVTPGREDGRLLDPAGRRFVLEIKGRSGTLKLSDVRQLDQWVRDGIAEGYEAKGLLVANLQSTVSPAERQDVIPDNCSRTAAKFGLCILTTWQLYSAIALHQEGRLDAEAFWSELYLRSGVASPAGKEALDYER